MNTNTQNIEEEKEIERIKASLSNVSLLAPLGQAVLGILMFWHAALSWKKINNTGIFYIAIGIMFLFLALELYRSVKKRRIVYSILKRNGII